MKRLVIAATAVLAGCTAGVGTVAPRQTSYVPSPTPAIQKGSASPFGVMVHRAGLNEPYYVQLVPLSGRAGAWGEAITRADKMYYVPLAPGTQPCQMCPTGGTANYAIPEISVSRTHVYFLDRETELRSLSPEGQIASVRRIAAEPNSTVAFAVSPDDTRIAIAVLAYGTSNTPPTLHLRLYVEDLVDGAHRVEIFTSSTEAEWPIGWHAGSLVVAVGSPGVGDGFDSAYGATGYHVVDPATGRRLATLLCATATGPLGSAGMACLQGSSLTRVGWDGAQTPLPLPANPGLALAGRAVLSPDGARVALSVFPAPGYPQQDTVVVGGGPPRTVVSGAWPLGWLDGEHLIVASAQQVSIVELASGSVVGVSGLMMIPRQGVPSFFGVLPESF